MFRASLLAAVTVITINVFLAPELCRSGCRNHGMETGMCHMALPPPIESGLVIEAVVNKN